MHPIYVMNEINCGKGHGLAHEHECKVVNGNYSRNKYIHSSSGSFERNVSKCCYRKNLVVDMRSAHYLQDSPFTL